MTTRTAPGFAWREGTLQLGYRESVQRNLETGCRYARPHVGLRGSSGRYPRNLVGLFQRLTQPVIFDGQALDVRYCHLKVLGEVLVVTTKSCDVLLT